MTNDAFRDMAATMRSRNGFDGEMLLFKKGRWLAGKDGVEMNGAELTALVEQMMYGWCKWEDKKPVDYCVGFVRDRFKPPRRSQLDDNDQTKWERPNNDPWQLTFFLPLADPNDGQLYIYPTQSRGGKDALADLQEVYADRGNADKQPRVALAADHYQHQDHGRVETPRFDIVGWVDPPPGLRPIRPPASSTLAIDQAAAPALPQPLGKITITSGRDAFVDDDVPF